MNENDKYIGLTLDTRYEILDRIGEGGMALVYKARDNRLDRLVAVKIMREEMAADEEVRRRFVAESHAVAMLSNPNIVAVYDVSHSDSMEYIVMELVDGITLKQYMDKKGALPWREMLHFSKQIARALGLCATGPSKSLILALRRWKTKFTKTTARLSARSIILRPSRLAASRRMRAATCIPLAS